MKKINQQQAKAKVILETRNKLKQVDDRGETLYSIKLRVTWMRKRRYYKLKIQPLSQKDWDRIERGTRLGSELEAVLDSVQVIEANAREILATMQSFGFDRFKEEFFVDHTIDKNDVYAAFGKYIQSLHKEGRTSTAINYNCSLSSLKKFRQSLVFTDVTPEFLQDYEDWMFEKDSSPSTVGIYLRALRVILNIALTDGLIETEQYPFGKKSHKKYQIPAGRNVKKAVSDEELELIKNHNPVEGSRAEKARSFWLFCYYINGMNVKDVANLKWENIDREAGMIRFVRKKTERANKGKTKLITAELGDFAKQVIEKYGKPSKNPKDYIFPVLNDSMTPEEVFKKLYGFTKMINLGMKQVATELGIKKGITTYTARHTHATVLLRNGATPFDIKENLGHASLKTTENYLGGIDDVRKKKMASFL